MKFVRQNNSTTTFGIRVTTLFGFALLQSAQAKRLGVAGALVLAENVLRSAIPLVMYALFEARTKNTALSLEVFFADRAHDFLAVVLLLLGVLLGFADINLRRSMATVRSLTARLRQYSEWSLGSGILDRAIADERTLLLQRVGRAVLFMDIRGFTAWSEQQTRACYDHLASELGVLIFDSLEQRRFLRSEGEGLELTPQGQKLCLEIGIDGEALGRQRRPLCRACPDWNMRRKRRAPEAGRWAS